MQPFSLPYVRKRWWRSINAFCHSRDQGVKFSHPLKAMSICTHPPQKAPGTIPTFLPVLFDGLGVVSILCSPLALSIGGKLLYRAFSVFQQPGKKSTTPHHQRETVLVSRQGRKTSRSTLHLAAAKHGKIILTVFHSAMKSPKKPRQFIVYEKLREFGHSVVIYSLFFFLQHD